MELPSFLDSSQPTEDEGEHYFGSCGAWMVTTQNLLRDVLGLQQTALSSRQITGGEVQDTQVMKLDRSFRMERPQAFLDDVLRT